MEDPELVRWVTEAKKGSEAAIRALVEGTQARLLRFLFLSGADQELARDLCQDTYIYAFEHLGELEKPAAFLSWIFRIGKHKLLDHRKSPKNSEHASLEDGPEPESESSGRNLELVYEVRQVLQHLNEDERAVLVLIDIEGRSYQEAAEIIGISEPAITSRLRRARATFEKHFYSDADDRKSFARSPSIRKGDS